VTVVHCDVDDGTRRFVESTHLERSVLDWRDKDTRRWGGKTNEHD
jgi:hypothetical protein